jgi:hypothetical protein
MIVEGNFHVAVLKGGTAIRSFFDWKSLSEWLNNFHRVRFFYVRGKDVKGSEWFADGHLTIRACPRRARPRFRPSA